MTDLNWMLRTRDDGRGGSGVSTIEGNGIWTKWGRICKRKKTACYRRLIFYSILISRISSLMSRSSPFSNDWIKSFNLAS